MIVIKNKDDYDNFTSSIRRKNVFVHCIKSKYTDHPAITDVMLMFVKNLDTNDTYLINFSHQDTFIFNCHTATECASDVSKLSKQTFVIDKKTFTHLTSEYNVDDLLIYEFDQGISQSNIDTFKSEYERNNRHIFYKNPNYNSVIPIVKHLEFFENIVTYYSKYVDDFKKYESYKNLNGIITETLTDVEHNGLHVNECIFSSSFPDKSDIPVDGFVYTEYNMFTSTGRPSNRCNGVNYAALNKENGCRASFDSRFGKDGMLITMDYSAYHPHIIANLINFKLNLNDNIYDYLGRYYFNIDRECSGDEIKKSKNLTFVNLYGGIRKEFEYIPYFQKTAEYIKHRWEYFNDNGYIETPIFKRRITKKHMMDDSPNKLFNYILQAAETEFSIKNINMVNRYLMGKKSKVVLYTYDSILLDACKDDGIDTLRQVKEIMIDNQFPVKCYAGRNYNESSLITL